MTEATEQAVPTPSEPIALDQALSIVAQVCAGFQGNLEQHQQIQTALDVVAKAALSTPTIVPEHDDVAGMENGNRAQRRASAKQ